MNYLAHAYFSKNDPALLVGNFIADHVRGLQSENFPAGIRSGIILHRNIDSFSDAHPEFRRAKRLFYAGFERYSGVLVDIYFDHLLAAHFAEYSQIPLAKFSSSAYEVYESHRELLPEGSKRFLDYVTRNNIYQSYATIQGISTVLAHLSHRIRHNIRLDESMTAFQSQQDAFALHFRNFFEDLRHEFR